ncbi:MAG: hypothetical protein WDA08_08500 [Weeksellaceae bacterium]
MKQIFLLLIPSFLFAQKVVVEMYDGTSKEGEMDLITTEMKTYKLYPIGRKGKVERIREKDVSSITFYLPEGVVTYGRVPIYRNPKNKKVAPKKAMLALIYKGENISLYHAYKSDARGVYRNLVTDEYYFCHRPGEEAASFVSWIFGGQINKNIVFRKVGGAYFEDYPELHQKIKNREYKYMDILEVVKEYDQWKSNQNEP